jgi:hypothetical protein
MKRRMMQKYTHPRAYFPEFTHGSRVSASISPEGLVLLYGILIRLMRDEIEPATSRPAERNLESMSSDSAKAGILKKWNEKKKKKKRKSMPWRLPLLKR